MLANFGSSSVTNLRILDDGSLGEETTFVNHIGKGKDPPSSRRPILTPSIFRRTISSPSFPILEWTSSTSMASMQPPEQCLL